MENLLQLQRGHKAYGSKLLFDEATFALNAGEHVGVIGPNGAGKSTLFKILIGEEKLDSGTIVQSRGLRLGYLSQHEDSLPGETLEEYVVRNAVLSLWELKSLGRGLGLEEAHYEMPISSLSGGYRMRGKLLGLLGQDPTLMLLDEPTNYLDLETLLVLEKFLQGFKHAFLLISHDREFLRRVTDHTLEIEGAQVTKYNGNIDDYFEQKELLRTQLEARAMSLAEKRKTILDFVARFGAKASKASQAQSRLKGLQKMESIELKALPVSARIRIPEPTRVGKLAMTVDRVTLGYGEKTILRNVSLNLTSGDHLAVVGYNGAGKSTFLKGIAGTLSPSQGKIELGYEVKVAFYNQHVAEGLDPTDTVLSALEHSAHRDVRQQEILDLAGSLLFSGDDVRKRISVLSGGEKSRVALGQVLLQKSSCLILDEPTNHLDFQTVEALTQALTAFKGSLVVVSHDRGFIRRIGTRILEIRGGEARLYPGTYDEYVWSVEKGAFQLPAKLEAATPARAKAPEPVKQDYGQRKERDRRLKQLEKILKDSERAILKSREALEAANHELAQGADIERSKSLIQELGSLQKTIDENEALWLSAEDERERLLRVISAES